MGKLEILNEIPSDIEHLYEIYGDGTYLDFILINKTRVVISYDQYKDQYTVKSQFGSLYKANKDQAWDFIRKVSKADKHDPFLEI